jgi:hypothetical protein
MLPPFAKQAAKHKTGDEIRIYVGSNRQGWEVARLRNSYGPAMLLPPGDDFRNYKWPVKGREVLMFQTGGYSQNREFAVHLVEQGARIVRALVGDKMHVVRGSHD